MNKKYLPALVCGFGASVLTSIPGIQSVACCFLIPIASALSIFLYKKSQPGLIRIETGTSLILGLFTAIFAAVFASCFDIIITYITKTNDLIASMPQTEKIVKDMNLGSAAYESIEILKRMANDIQTKGFSFLYVLMISITNLISYSIFGMIGGLLGSAIVNRRNINLN